MALYDTNKNLIAGSRKTNIYRCNSFAEYEALPAAEKAKYDYVATNEDTFPISVVFDDTSIGSSIAYTLSSHDNSHYECRVYYYGGLCGIFSLCRNQFGNNGGRISTVWESSSFQNYSISIDQSTGIVTMSATTADAVEFIITKLP